MSEFGREWHKAIRNFTVVQHTANGLPAVWYVHAEADTGSRYEVVGCQTNASWRGPDPTQFISMVYPWPAAWTAPFKGLIYPDYAIEKWGKERIASLRTMHGGDAAALVMCLNMANGFTMDEAIEFAFKFYKEDA